MYCRLGCQTLTPDLLVPDHPWAHGSLAAPYKQDGWVDGAAVCQKIVNQLVDLLLTAEESSLWGGVELDCTFQSLYMVKNELRIFKMNEKGKIARLSALSSLI